MAISLITSAFAQEFADFVHRATGYHSIVCDASGTIVGDSARTRIGVVHAGSKKINTTPGMTEIFVTAEEAEGNPNIKEGLSQAILLEDRKIGTYGIAGRLEIVKPLVKIASAIISERLREMERKNAVEKAVNNVSHNVRQTTAAVQAIVAATAQQCATTEQVVQVSRDAAHKVADTSQILDMSRSIALQTKLLGLNASVEAARAGNEGRSFSILAKEMQKLAEESAGANSKINQILSEIQDAIHNAITEIDQLSAASAEQAQAMQEIVRRVEDVEKSSYALATAFNPPDRR